MTPTTKAKVGDWIAVPKATELAGYPFQDNEPLLVTYIYPDDSMVVAGGVYWTEEEYHLVPSPLFRVGKKQNRVILTSEGMEVAHFLPEYAHLIPEVLRALNSQYL